MHTIHMNCIFSCLSLPLECKLHKGENFVYCYNPCTQNSVCSILEGLNKYF